MSRNSQLFHIVINGCKNVLVEEVNVIAASNSPNTDGIHVETSTHVTIIDSIIQTGDDCISIGPGSYNLWIQRIRCGPGHGIRYFYIFNLSTLSTMTLILDHTKHTLDLCHSFYIFLVTKILVFFSSTLVRLGDQVITLEQQLDAHYHYYHSLGLA